MMNPNEAKSIFEDELEEEYQRNVKIISCLESFENIVDEKYCLPIEITREDRYAVFKLIENNIEYMEEVLLLEKPFESICLKIFNLLFIENRKLNYAQIEEKITDFQLIIKLLKNEFDQNEQKKYINEVIKMRKIKEWKTLLNSYYIVNGGLSFLIAVALKFSKTIVEISDFLIYILKKKHENTFEVRFDLNKLKDVSEENIAKNFVELFKDETEYFYLDFQNNKIEKKLFSPEITFTAINEIKNDNHSFKIKKKKKKKKKQNKKENQKVITNNNLESEIKEEGNKKGKSNEEIESEKEEFKENQVIEDIESQKEEEYEDGRNLEDIKSEKKEEEYEEKKTNEDIGTEKKEEGHMENQANEDLKSKKKEEELKKGKNNENIKSENKDKKQEENKSKEIFASNLNKANENTEFIREGKKEIINIESSEISPPPEINITRNREIINLKDILDKFNAMEKKIENQNQEIENQKKEIKSQNKVMESLNQEIENQKKEIKSQNKVMESLNQEIENQKKAMESKNQEIEDQKKEIKSQKKAMESQKKEIENIKKSSNLRAKNIQKKLYDMKGRLEKISTDINLIKSRSALKSFIDLFYRGFGFKGEKSYEDKFSRISEKLNEYNTNSDDQVILNRFRFLLKESALKLKYANFEAHNIDKSKPIFPQIFKIIDSNGSYGDLEKRLKSIRADIIILNSIKNKETYYQDYQREALIQTEQKTFSEVTPEKLRLMFLMEKIEK